MSYSDLQKRVRARLDRLSEERLRVADDFLAYLAELESAEATGELLRMPGMTDAIREARAEADAGRISPLEDVAWKDD